MAFSNHWWYGDYRHVNKSDGKREIKRQTHRLERHRAKEEIDAQVYEPEKGGWILTFERRGSRAQWVGDEVLELQKVEDIYVSEEYDYWNGYLLDSILEDEEILLQDEEDDQMAEFEQILCNDYDEDFNEEW